jgi:amino acid adenylation domain-containing protein
MHGGAEHLDNVGGAGRLLAATEKWGTAIDGETAVSCQDGQLTFGQLRGHWWALVAALATAGVGVGTPVGLFTGRSRFAVSSLLAVWSLGATAVPIDPRHPAERIDFVLRDSDVRLLLTEQTPADWTSWRGPTVNPACVDVTERVPERVPVPDADQCAYVIYTSGTTGWPKGVEVTYRNLGTFLDALAGLVLPRGGMGVNAVSPAFDGWLWCALLYLLHGQGMAVIDVAGRQDVDLTELIAEHRPRTICLTPTLLSVLDPMPDAEVVVVAGEPCPPTLARRVAARSRLLNVYGPTETTIAATWSDSARGDDPTTVGRPLPGYTAYVLDSTGRPVRDGSIGELYIGGSAVARGYRNGPHLTAQRFVPDPFLGGGARMYRTGDLVAMRPDGQFDFCGRGDDQVKVHGVRVELGEVEKVAMEVAGVRAVAAFVVGAGDGLGLAVVPGSAAAMMGELTGEIRKRCANLLPRAMVPVAIDVVPTLPFLVTGKVDRAALTRDSSAAAPVSGRPPSTEREHQVCQIWSELLARRVDDVDANFFELGGYSLLAARAVGEIRAQTGLRLSVRHLLANPTAATLALELDKLAIAAGSRA